MIVTLELPDALARQLLALPEPEQASLVAEALEDRAARFEPVDLDDLPPGDKEATLRGMADVDAGRTVPGPEAFARLDAYIEARIAEKAQAVK